ncbi:MAG: FCD domain-containing protein [Microbacterium sp.]|uniref:FadR/GntR family transcriptional regulator n=1 Tax=Microbacterium sp. TaxID=51671 RepID=UPI0039E6DD9B
MSDAATNDGEYIPLDEDLPHSLRLPRRGLHAEVTSSLGRDIVAGVLAPGASINTEEVCARLQVSRSVVRESLRALESVGMISAKPRIGTRVNPPLMWDMLNPQVVAWRGSGATYLQQMREMLELRLGVEVAAAGLAAERMPAARVEDLRTRLANMNVAVARDDVNRFVEEDAAFHTIIMTSCENAFIAQIATPVTAVLATRQDDDARFFSAHTPHSLDQHEQLVDAIASADRDSAEKWARAIVQETLGEFGERASR